MRKVTIKSFAVLASGILISSVFSACGGSSAPATNTSGIMISGLTYDPITQSVFSVNTSGNLCTITAKQVPDNISCDIPMPNGIIISSQVVSDGSGNVYAIGKQSTTATNYILRYSTQTKLWSSTQIDLPYLSNRNKLLFKGGNLYTSDPNTKTLYTINIAQNSLQQTENYFIESKAIVEDFTPSGNLFFSHGTNNLDPNTFRTNPATTVYNINDGTSGSAATQFGLSNLSINDLVYANGNIYGCAESNFVYLPVNATSSESWQVLHDGAGYFSCDYVTTDSTANLYYVEGRWLDNSTFSNGYINRKAF